MKTGSHRYDINRTTPRHGHKYTKFKMCFSMMMVVCNKQHLSNIWSWIHGKRKQHWGWAEKSVAYKKMFEFAMEQHFFIQLNHLFIYR